MRNKSYPLCLLPVMKIPSLTFISLASVTLSLTLSCTAQEKEPRSSMLTEEEKASLETATFGAGSFGDRLALK